MFELIFETVIRLKWWWLKHKKNYLLILKIIDTQDQNILYIYNINSSEKIEVGVQLILKGYVAKG